jgi:hypothetical protein
MTKQSLVYTKPILLFLLIFNQRVLAIMDDSLPALKDKPMKYTADFLNDHNILAIVEDLLAQPVDCFREGQVELVELEADYKPILAQKVSATKQAYSNSFFKPAQQPILMPEQRAIPAATQRQIAA